MFFPPILFYRLPLVKGQLNGHFEGSSDSRRLDQIDLLPLRCRYECVGHCANQPCCTDRKRDALGVEASVDFRMFY